MAAAVISIDNEEGMQVEGISAAVTADQINIDGIEAAAGHGRAGDIIRVIILIAFCGQHRIRISAADGGMGVAICATGEIMGALSSQRCALCCQGGLKCYGNQVRNTV